MYKYRTHTHTYIYIYIIYASIYQLLFIAEQATHRTPIVGEGNFCQKAEGKFVKGAGALANPGGAAGCVKGGKCMFKFAKCTKCGRGEAGIKVP